MLVQFEKIIRNISNHLWRDETEVTLFVGAGLSAASGLPTSKDLTKELIDEFYPDINKKKSLSKDLEAINNNLELLTRKYEDDMGPKTPHLIVAKIIAKHEENATLDLYRKLNSIPFSYYITTNYDCLLEKENDRLRHRIVRGEGSVSSTFFRSPLLLKLHGDIDTPENMILTQRDIIDYAVNHKQMVKWLYRILEKGPVLFLGYSRQIASINSLISRYLDQNPPENKWYAVTQSAEVAELYTAHGEYIDYANADLQDFINALIQYYKGESVDVPNGFAENINHALHDIHLEMMQLITLYDKIKGVIDSYQDPATRQIATGLLQAQAHELMLEKMKKEEILEILCNQEGEIDYEAAKEEAGAIYDTALELEQLEIHNSILSKLLPGQKLFDIALIWKSYKEFKDITRKYMIYFKPDVNTTSVERKRQDDLYMKAIELRLRNRQAEFIAEYLILKYQKVAICAMRVSQMYRSYRLS